MPHQQWLEFWYQASLCSIGIVIETDDVPRLTAKLYQARVAADDPTLKHLILRKSPEFPDSEIWIIKDGTEVD